MIGLEQRLAGPTPPPSVPPGSRTDHRAPGPPPPSLAASARTRVRLAGALRPLDDDEQSRRRHQRVMMLLVAPCSMPSLISWFTLVISFSKLARATAYAWPVALTSSSRTAVS